MFILVNAAMFIRPSDLVPALANWPIYESLVIVCLLVSVSPILRQLRGRELLRQPITLCVVGLLPAVILSHLSHFNLYGARVSAPVFAKLVLYYLLLVGLVTSAGRLRCLLFWLVVFIAIVTVLSLLDYHGVMELPPLAAERARAFDPTRPPPEVPPVVRLSAFGIFGNPNDLSRILVIGMMLCLYWLTERRAGLLRMLWLAPLFLFGYALQLTESRGGFLAFLGGLGALFAIRFGRLKTLMLFLLILPPLFVLYAGRQTELSTSEGTGQQRIQIWAEGLGLFKTAPLFGIGMDQYGEHVGYVAHNSFVHCFVELGFFGGLLFFGAFYLAVRGLHAADAPQWPLRDPRLIRMRPYLMGITVAYIVGMLTSTRSYTGPTYMLLGFAAAYLDMAAVSRGRSINRFDAQLAHRLLFVGVLVLMATWVYVKFSVRWGTKF